MSDTRQKRVALVTGTVAQVILSLVSLVTLPTLLSCAGQCYTVAQDMEKTSMNNFEGYEDLRISCPPGARLVGPLEPNEATLTVNGRTTGACKTPDGINHGPSVTWYANGTKANAGEYRNGHKEGEWKFWHENGFLSGQGVFHNDKPEGSWVSWHDNGQKESEGTYVGGLQQGRFTYWNRESHVTRVLIFDRGNPIDRES